MSVSPFREQVWRSKNYDSVEVIVLAVAEDKVVFVLAEPGLFNSAALVYPTEKFLMHYEFKD